MPTQYLLTYLKVADLLARSDFWNRKSIYQYIRPETSIELTFPSPPDLQTNTSP